MSKLEIDMIEVNNFETLKLDDQDLSGARSITLHLTSGAIPRLTVEYDVTFTKLRLLQAMVENREDVDTFNHIHKLLASLEVR